MMETEQDASPPKTPCHLKALFVDLDGTLIATDLLWESLFLVVKRQPWALLLLPIWLSQGRPVLKRKLAERANLDPRLLPFRKEVLEFLKIQQANGWKLILATASDQLLADKLADELKLFEDRICNDGKTNMKGRAKLQQIEAYCQLHGVKEFGYIGDAAADLPIWEQANHVYAVTPGALLRQSLTKLGKPVEIIGTRTSTLKAVWRELRPHQWVKNILLAVPLILAHEFFALDKLFALAVAFLAFSACASSVYVMNDLMDLEADRAHPRKRLRPLASGALPLPFGPLLVVSLLATAFSVSFVCLPLLFVGFLVVYLVLNVLYSGWLKKKIMVDVLLLAGFYTLRILAGGIAVAVTVTEWLMAFSMFFFLSLAFVKRYAELSRLQLSESKKAPGRGYYVADLSLIESMGPNCGFLAVLVLALYIHSPHIKPAYNSVIPLWLLCPLLLYWISRIWFLAKRGVLTEDPVLFALKDKPSLLVGIMAVLLLILASCVPIG